MKKCVPAVLILLLSVTVLFAADLKTYQANYDKQMSAIILEHGATISKLNESYSQALNTLNDRVSNTGDLDKAKEILAEIERFGKIRTVTVTDTATSSEKLKKVQLSYIRSMKGIVFEKARKIDGLAAKYDAALARLQASLTRQKNYDKATAIQSERKRVVNSDEILAAKKCLNLDSKDVKDIEVPQQEKKPMFASKKKLEVEPESLEKDGDGAWKANSKTRPFSDDVDRIFVVNQDWVEGRVLQIDDKAVVMDIMGQQKAFARKDISLLELSDWLNPDLRNDEKMDVRVKFRLEGDTEAATLFFTKGTIIKEVHSRPTFIKGDDQDDKAEAEATRIWFEKGSKDRSITVLDVDVTLSLGSSDELRFEIYNNRANCSAGKVTLKILESETDKPIAEFKEPINGMWCMSSIPVTKLKPSRSPLKLKRFEIFDVKLGKVPLEEPHKAPVKGTRPARVVLANHKILTGALVGMDEESLAIQLKTVGPYSTIPRKDVALIELYDWEADWKGSGLKKVAADTETAPIRIIFAGSSSEGNVTIQSGDVLSKVISPPHYLYGRDFNDMGFITSEREFGFTKHTLDRSLMQVEAIVTLEIKKKPSLRLSYANRYTNILAGDVKVYLINALTGKTYWSSPATAQNAQNSEFTIQRDRLFK